MADFVTQSTVKSAVRELSAPIADVAAFAGIVQGVLTDQSLRVHRIRDHERPHAGNGEDPGELYRPDRLPG